jgi:hypothetical protein
VLTKHFGIFTLRQLQRDMPTSSDVAARVVEELKNTNLVVNPGGEIPGKQSNFLHDRLAEALDRDFASRYERALQRSVFPELSKTDEFGQLAAEILDTKGIALSPSLKRTIILRAARSAAVRGNLPDATRFLAAGQSLPGSDSDAPARARLAVAQGRIDEAIQILRDLTDPDSRSTLFSILGKERSADVALGDHRSRLSASDSRFGRHETGSAIQWLMSDSCQPVPLTLILIWVGNVPSAIFR